MILKNLLLVIAAAILFALWNFVPAVPRWVILVAAALLFITRFSLFLFHAGMFFWGVLLERGEKKREREKARAFDRLQRTPIVGEAPAFLTDPDHEPPMTAA